jgi:hypothetical protein
MYTYIYWVTWISKVMVESQMSVCLQISVYIYIHVDSVLYMDTVVDSLITLASWRAKNTARPQ